MKSLAGIAVDAFRLTDRGPAHDRRWMLVDAEGGFLTQRRHPQMALLATAIEDAMLCIYERTNPSDRLVLPLQPQEGEELHVHIWEDACIAVHPSPDASAWLSLRLGVPVKLVYMPDMTRRLVDPDYARQGEVTSFSDGYPLLAIGQSSLDDLNERLPIPVTMERFRPNIVFTGAPPYFEDRLASFHINGISFQGVKPCARCVLTTVNPLTGETGPEPLRTLASYRTLSQKVLFGMNLLYQGHGSVHVGDRMVLVETS